MARRKAIEIVVADGTCGCGCGEQVAKHRTYRQGHDARLRGILGRAHREGIPVRTVINGTRETTTGLAQLKARGWPVPA